MKKQLELPKKVWSVLPYLYFIGLAALWFVGDLASQKFSFMALGVLIGLFSLAVWQNKIAGTCLGLLAAIGSLYAFFAVLSEFNDFDVVNTSAIQLIAVGSLLTLSGLAMGVLLTVTNMKRLAV